MTVKTEPLESPETYYAGAYWGPRKEAPEECARRTATFLNLLAPCDPFLAHWYKPTRSRKDARKYPLMPPDVPTLTELFRRGVNREKGGPVFEQLGFTFWFDNGGDQHDRANLQITCGCYSDAAPNCCVLLPRTLGLSANANRVLTSSVLTGALRAMALAWEPDWSVAISAQHRDLMKPRRAPGAPYVGWLTYLSRHLGTVPPLPAPVRIEPVEDKGTLIVLTPERFTVTNPEHVALAERVRELLGRAGLLMPKTPSPTS